MLLVLDLDETLLHAADEPLERAPDFRAAGYHVYLRPFLSEFLKFAFDRFTVGVWTSSSPGYAQQIVGRIVPRDRLRFVFDARRCTLSRDWSGYEPGGFVRRKPIAKLRRFGFEKTHILAVDDTPAKWSRSYGNLVRVTPFEGDATDEELRALAAYLDELGSVGSVRSVEKRGWRSVDRAPVF